MVGREGEAVFVETLLLMNAKTVVSQDELGAKLQT